MKLLTAQPALESHHTLALIKKTKVDIVVSIGYTIV